jgi:hypothetical protein
MVIQFPDAQPFAELTVFNFLNGPGDAGLEEILDRRSVGCIHIMQNSIQKQEGSTPGRGLRIIGPIVVQDPVYLKKQGFGLFVQVLVHCRVLRGIEKV